MVVLLARLSLFRGPQSKILLEIGKYSVRGYIGIVELGPHSLNRRRHFLPNSLPLLIATPKVMGDVTGYKRRNRRFAIAT
jgi:hypothetical protein